MSYSSAVFLTREAIIGMGNPIDQYKMAYGKVNGLNALKHQTEVGKVSKLITAMAENGATNDELIRVIRHSMVIMDAFKCNLDYKQSEADYEIAELQKKYQPKIYK